MNETADPDGRGDGHDCPTCDGLTAAEREARAACDHSRATDCRVLLRRHMDDDHRPERH
ncbi:hypothetical protein ACFVIM_08805 [Streptomyces sp. NPDC057638]|uniref:hypothetical protein n=1 Tax=Streptomyces sp. NPDC057638 TaxID=3346190 RepID=UPI00368077AA